MSDLHHRGRKGPGLPARRCQRQAGLRNIRLEEGMGQLSPYRLCGPWSLHDIRTCYQRFIGQAATKPGIKTEEDPSLRRVGPVDPHDADRSNHQFHEFYNNARRLYDRADRL